MAPSDRVLCSANTTGVAVLTGGTSGLGRYIALGLVQAGWVLVLVARDPAKATAARTWLETEVPGAVVEVEYADLSLLADVEVAAARIAARHPKVGRLVLNAGMLQGRRRITAEGREQVLAVNTLAPFVLIRELQGALGAAGGARIVVVSSSTSDRAGMDPDNLELGWRWNLVTSYARSKLAVMMLGFEWARRLAPDVSVIVVHPGTVATSLVRVGGVVGLVWRGIGRFVMTAEQGATAPLRAALDPTLQGVTGRYLKPQGLVSPNRRALDLGLVLRVWQATERLVGPPHGTEDRGP